MANEKRLIDANAVLKELDKFINPMPDANGLHFISGLSTAITEIENAPSVDAVEVVHGRWIHCQGKSNLWYCSECGEKILYNPTRRTYNIEKRPVHEVNKYCRGCGAKMDGDSKV